jgi:hypothetical protein
MILNLEKDELRRLYVALQEKNDRLKKQFDESKDLSASLAESIFISIEENEKLISYLESKDKP